jgi:hypothetical protein
MVPGVDTPGYWLSPRWGCTNGFAAWYQGLTPLAIDCRLVGSRENDSAIGYQGLTPLAIDCRPVGSRENDSAIGHQGLSPLAAAPLGSLENDYVGIGR